MTRCPLRTPIASHLRDTCCRYFAEAKDPVPQDLMLHAPRCSTPRRIVGCFLDTRYQLP